jgi:hypothetical protein
VTGPAVITTAPDRPRRWGRLRGTWAVIALLLSALDHLVAAVIGCLPIAVIVRRFAVPVAAAWRSGRRRTASTSPVVYLASPASKRSHDDGRTCR